MNEEEWLVASDSTSMLRHLGNRGSKRKRRLFGCACCRRIWHWILEGRCRWAVEVAERYADGDADDLEVGKAMVSAGEGMRALTDDPSWAAFYTLPSTRDGRVDLFDTENAITVASHASMAAGTVGGSEYVAEAIQQVLLVREIFGNPFRPVSVDPLWRTSTVMQLATGIYNDRAFDRMPILADALQDAGCDSDDILNHLRDANATHVRGCWALDLILGKE